MCCEPFHSHVPLVSPISQIQPDQRHILCVSYGSGALQGSHQRLVQRVDAEPRPQPVSTKHNYLGFHILGLSQNSQVYQKSQLKDSWNQEGISRKTGTPPTGNYGKYSRIWQP